MTRAYLGVGGNLGDRMENLAAALRAVDALPGTAVVAVSRVYESEPWPDPGQPPYANMVAVVETGLAADVLLGGLQEIERAQGRTPGPRNAPRPIDLDIVLFGDEEWESEELTVPHPRFAEREFVVLPLLEADPLAVLPDGTRVSDAGARTGRVTAVLGALPGFEDVTRTPGVSPDTDAGEEWVTVAESKPLPGTPDMGLVFKRVVLEEEGIPHAWDPFAPEEASNPYGLTPLFRLKVPASLAERARRVIADAEAAPPEAHTGGQGPDLP